MNTTNPKPTEQAAKHPRIDLEMAIDKAMALLEMQGEQLAKLREEERTDNRAGAVASGIVLLASETARELHAAFDQEHAAYVAEREEARAQPPAIAQLANVLELNADQARALALIGEWEGGTVENYVRRVLFAMMVSSFEDMGQVAKGKGRSADVRAWAKRFHPQVAALMPEGGWKP